MKKIVFLIVGIIAVSTASIFIRMAQGEISSLVISAYRLSVAVLFLVPFSIKSIKSDFYKINGTETLLLILSGICLALHFFTWITSLELTTVSSSVVLVTTTPIWVAILTPIILKTKIKREIFWGISLALLGGLIIVFGNLLLFSGFKDVFIKDQIFGSISIKGNLLALSGAWFASGYIIIGKKLRKNISILSYTTIVYGVAAIILLVSVIIAGDSLFGYSLKNTIWLFLIAIVPQIIGHSTFNWALKYYSAAFVSIAMIGEPIGAILLAIIFLGEFPTMIEVFGGLIIIIGIVIAAINEPK